MINRPKNAMKNSRSFKVKRRKNQTNTQTISAHNSKAHNGTEIEKNSIHTTQD
jgi:hypothetical protein